MSEEKRIIVEDGNEVPTVESTEEAAPCEEITLTDQELKTLCTERICPECSTFQDAEDVRLRALAETENVKKRLEREKEDYCKFASETILRDLLPILDNLDLALMHGGDDPACKNLIMGVDMTRKIFLDTLNKHGLETVGELGEEFSPEIHEAVGHEERADMQEGHVCTLMQRGYRLKGRVLRPARVVVSKAC